MKFIKYFKESLEDNSKYKVSNSDIIGSMLKDRADNQISGIQLNRIVGKIIKDISYDKESILFTCVDQSNNSFQYLFEREQDYYSDIVLDDISGDLSDLIDTPLIKFEERKSNEDEIDRTHPDESFTWTFYKFATIKGYVDIRFYGCSNGYYAESVNIYEITKLNRIYNLFNGSKQEEFIQSLIEYDVVRNDDTIIRKRLIRALEDCGKEDINLFDISGFKMI